MSPMSLRKLSWTKGKRRPIDASPVRARVVEPTAVQVCPSVEVKLVIVLPVRVSLSQVLGGAVAGPA